MPSARPWTPRFHGTIDASVRGGPASAPGGQRDTPAHRVGPRRRHTARVPSPATASARRPVQPLDNDVGGSRRRHAHDPTRGAGSVAGGGASMKYSVPSGAMAMSVGPLSAVSPTRSTTAVDLAVLAPAHPLPIVLGGDQPSGGVEGQSRGAARVLGNHRGLFALMPTQHLTARRIGEHQRAVNPDGTVGELEVGRDPLHLPVILEEASQRRRRRRAFRRWRDLRGRSGGECRSHNLNLQSAPRRLRAP